MSPAFIGTSGWSYNHWIDSFYPRGLDRRMWLEFYAERFDTVELNASFYRLLQEKTFRSWHSRTPDEFRFSVKMSRYVTHIKKLRDPRDTLPKFFKGVGGLREKCHVILIQLPPGLGFRGDVAEGFMDELTSAYGGYRYVMECRNVSWFSEEAYRLMSRYGIALCFADTPSYPYEEEETADFIYIRLHGREVLYASEYSIEELRIWAGKVGDWMDAGREVYVYFDNDAQGFAPRNAEALKKLVYLK